MPVKKTAVMNTASEQINETMSKYAPEMVEESEKAAVNNLPVAYQDLPALPASFEAAMAEMQEHYGAPAASFNAYPLLRDKSKLLDVEFLIERFDFVLKKDGNINYVNVKGITRQGNKRFAFNDGGTGVMRSLIDFEKRTGRNGNIHCPMGLRVSQYEAPDGSDAETYYLN